MNAPIGFDGKPLKATKYAIDERGVEHIMWEKELPPGWRRKYVPASNWQGFMDCLERKRSVRGAVLAGTFLAFTFLGYHAVSPKTDIPTTRPPQSVEQPAQGSEQRIDISKINPFGTAEASPQQAAAKKSQSLESSNASKPVGQPRPNLPSLPPIPVRNRMPQQAPVVQAPATQPPTSAKQEKSADESTYQSKIAFIGGEGTPSGEQK